jgi:hypothetical protein
MSLVDHDDYARMERALKCHSDTCYSGEDLAKALRDCGGKRPMPPVVLEYFCAFLEGKVKKKRGRKKGTGLLQSAIRNVLAPFLHAKYLAWLLKREKTQGLKGWPKIREADWWQDGDSPHVRAAKMVRWKYFRHMDVPAVRNSLSKLNSH